MERSRWKVSRYTDSDQPVSTANDACIQIHLLSSRARRRCLPVLLLGGLSASGILVQGYDTQGVGRSYGENSNGSARSSGRGVRR
jgi:hypothetical protein